uniref:Bravo_FIGEY domain-containing protein n=1 Tax=Panagrellus redivivus TaxID=6233 RepID=A0A7E4VZJ6_PANRE
MATDTKAASDDITQRTGSSDDVVDETVEQESDLIFSDVSSEPSSTMLAPPPGQPPRHFPPLCKDMICTILPMEIKIHNAPLAPHMRSIIERKIYDLTEPVYYDQIHSTTEAVYLYYIEITGLVTRLKFIVSPNEPLKFIDHHYVVNAYPLEYINSTEPLEDRMRFSMRFIVNDKVFLSNGRGKVSIYHMRQDTPYEWILLSSCFIPYGSDNVFDIMSVNFALPSRKGYPLVITDARTQNMAYDVLLVTPIHRPAYARKPGQTAVATKIFWLTFGNNQNQKVVRMLRHRVFEVEGIFECALLSDKSDEISVIGSHAPVLIYDSTHAVPDQGVRDIISYAPLMCNYEWFQSATTVLLIFPFKKFICESDFTVEYRNDNIIVNHRRNVLVSGKMGGTIILAKCRSEVRHSFDTNYGTFTVELAKAEINKSWEYAVNHPHRGIEKKSVVEDPAYDSVTINVYNAEAHEVREVTLNVDKDGPLFSGLPHVPKMYVPLGTQLLEFSFADGQCQNNVTLENFKLQNSAGKIYASFSNGYFVQILNNKNMIIQRYKDGNGENSDIDYVCAPEYTTKGEDVPDVMGIVPLRQGMIFFTKDRFYVTRVC